MSNTTATQKTPILSSNSSAEQQNRTPGNIDADQLEAMVTRIESMCGQVLCEGLFLRMIDFDLMAVTCERSAKVFDWWQMMLRLGHPEAPVAWAEIKARMDAREAARAIEVVCQPKVA